MIDKNMENTEVSASDKGRIVRTSVDPGICGFCGSISASPNGKKFVELQIVSECKNIQRLAMSLKKITLHELFQPLSHNPVFIAAERSKCHQSCLYPAAVMKITEVALAVALPKAANITFEPQEAVRE